MDFVKFEELLWELVQADKGPERKLDEILWQLSIPERICFLKYILIEYKEGAVENMLNQRIEHEEPPLDLPINQEGLTARDSFYLHLVNLWELISRMCTKIIPAKLKAYEKDINELAQREKVLSALSVDTNKGELEEELLNTEEAAAFLGVRVPTIYSYNHKGLLKPVTHGGKLAMYPKSQLIRLRRHKK